MSRTDTCIGCRWYTPETRWCEAWAKNEDNRGCGVYDAPLDADGFWTIHQTSMPPRASAIEHAWRSHLEGVLARWGAPTLDFELTDALDTLGGDPPDWRGAEVTRG